MDDAVNDERIFDVIVENNGEVDSQARVILTPEGLKEVAKLDRRGHKMLYSLCFYSLTDSQFMLDKNIVSFLSASTNDAIRDRYGKTILSYQQRYRGIRSLVEAGFLFPTAVSDQWSLNPDYLSLIHPRYSRTRSIMGASQGLDEDDASLRGMAPAA